MNWSFVASPKFKTHRLRLPLKHPCRLKAARMGFGFRVRGLGFRVEGLGFWVLRFRLQGQTLLSGPPARPTTLQAFDFHAP